MTLHCQLLYHFNKNIMEENILRDLLKIKITSPDRQFYFLKMRNDQRIFFLPVNTNGFICIDSILRVVSEQKMQFGSCLLEQEEKLYLSAYEKFGTLPLDRNAFQLYAFPLQAYLLRGLNFTYCIQRRKKTELSITSKRGPESMAFSRSFWYQRA